MCRPGRGSLGEVMPRSLVDLFEEASRTTDRVVRWTLRDGSSHVLLAVRHDPSIPPEALPRQAEFPPTVDDFEPIS